MTGTIQQDIFTTAVERLCTTRRNAVEIGAHTGIRTKLLANLFDTCYTFENYTMEHCKEELHANIANYNNIQLIEDDFRKHLDMLAEIDIDLIFIDLGFDGYDESKPPGDEFSENIEHYNTLFNHLSIGGTYILDVEDIQITGTTMEIHNGMIFKKTACSSIVPKLRIYHMNRIISGDFTTQYNYE